MHTILAILFPVLLTIAWSQNQPSPAFTMSNWVHNDTNCCSLTKNDSTELAYCSVCCILGRTTQCRMVRREIMDYMTDMRGVPKFLGMDVECKCV
jgi:hypothetical protein